MVTFSTISDRPDSRECTLLPENYNPGPYDVICGRGKDVFNSFGNRRFRITIELNLPRYCATQTKLEKSLMVLSIIDMVRQNGKGFVKKDSKTGRWFQVSNYMAREKVGQTLRELIIAKDPARKAEKRMKRAVRRAERNQRRKSRQTKMPTSLMSALICPDRLDLDVSPQHLQEMLKQGRRNSDLSDLSDDSLEYEMDTLFDDDCIVPPPPELERVQSSASAA